MKHSSLMNLQHQYHKLLLFYSHFFLLLGLILQGELGSCSSSGSESVGGGGGISKWVVRDLPGYHGDHGLPFHLETGYVGVGESMEVELFYYFVRSERNPNQDPLLLWLTGGPRCSTFSAFAFEIGPIIFETSVEYNGSLPTFVLNPHSWTKVANIIFLDAPVDTGFSYSKSSQPKVIGDKESTETTYEFLVKWLSEHPEFQSNPLYIGGDSYSGRIIPPLVQNLTNDIEGGKYSFINFQGFILGNPGTDSGLEANTKIPLAHGLGLISDELYESLKENCKENYVNIDKGNIKCWKNLQDYGKCTMRLNPAHILEPICFFFAPKLKNMLVHRRSLTKINKDFTTLPPGFRECRSYGYTLAEYWANDDRVRKALHIKEGTVKNWIRCRYDLPYRSDNENIIEYHRNLSRKGYISLIYSGDHDMLVSHKSTEKWIRLLDLPVVDDWRPWLVNEQVAGYTRSYSSGMTYATIKGGGHTAPEYKPEECFAMFERFSSRNPL